MILYHRTTIGNARATMKDGFDDERWAFGLRDVRTGENVKSVGVWLADRPLGIEEGPPGDAVLEVRLDLSEETLAAFEIEGLFADARLFVVPAELVNAHSKLRILNVDPKSSGWFEAVSDEGQDG